jgi:hypothetical protein
MQELNRAKKDAFLGEMVGVLNGAMLVLMSSIGRQTGLLETMGHLLPSTSEGVAQATGLHERYVREWLGAQDNLAHPLAPFILQRRKPRPLGVVRDKRLCLTKVLGLKHWAAVWARMAPVQIEAECWFSQMSETGLLPQRIEL